MCLQEDVYLFEDGDVRRLSATEAMQVLSSCVIPGLRYIADGASPLKTAPDVEQSFVAHSPDRSKYKEYMKPPKHLSRPLWMPFWEIDELETLRAKCFEGKVTHEEMQQLTGKRGAVPSLVLDYAEDAGVGEDIRDTISELRIDDLIYAAPGTSQATHWVVRVHPARWRKGDVTKYELGFLSPWIERTVAEVLLSRMASNLIALMQLTQQSPNQLGGALAANFLESVTTGILLKGGSFHARCGVLCTLIPGIQNLSQQGLHSAVDDKLMIPAPAGSSNLSETPLADSTSTEPSAPSSSSSSTQAPAGDTAKAIGSSITQAPAGDSDSDSDSASASSQASADTGGSALGLQRAAEPSTEGTLLLPELTEWFSMGLMTFRNCLLETADMWGQHSFKARDVPAIDSLPTSGMCAIKTLADEDRQLVEDRIRACETQYKIAIPISVFQAEPQGPPPDQPPILPQKPEQPKAALSMGDSMARHPTFAPPSFLLGARARTQLRSPAWPRPALPRARPLSASYIQAVGRSFL